MATYLFNPNHQEVHAQYAGCKDAEHLGNRWIKIEGVANEHEAVCEARKVHDKRANLCEHCFPGQ